jgi:hypothetical protein
LVVTTWPTRTYRMVQPLNAEAERIHMLLGTVGMHF